MSTQDERMQRSRDQYDSLPECIKSGLSFDEWRWMSDARKSTLIESETEPDDDVVE